MIPVKYLNNPSNKYDKNIERFKGMVPMEMGMSKDWKREFERAMKSIPRVVGLVHFGIDEISIPIYDFEMYIDRKSAEEKVSTYNNINFNGVNEFVTPDTILSTFIDIISYCNWFKWKSFMSVDNTLMNELYETFDDKVILTKNDFKMPYKGMYVKLGDGIDIDDEIKLDGFYVWEEDTDRNEKQIYFVPYSSMLAPLYDYRVTMRSFFRITLTNKGKTLKEIIDNENTTYLLQEDDIRRSNVWKEYVYVKEDRDRVIQMMLKHQMAYNQFMENETTKSVIKLMVSTLRYICASNADISMETIDNIENRKNKKKHNKKGINENNESNESNESKESKEVRIGKVGENVGILIRELKSKHKATTKKEVIDGKEVRYHIRPHIRKAHYEWYRVGKGRKEKELRWIKPQFINYELFGYEIPKDVIVTKVKE